MSAGWRLPALAAADESLDLAAVKLAAEFGQFDISICRGRQGRSLVALRRRGTAGSGLSAVITPDPDEMREALLEDSPPGSGPP